MTIARFLLKIDPPQPCLYTDEDGQPCSHLTAYAEASGGTLDAAHQLWVSPYCWKHLDFCIPLWCEDPTPEEVVWERFCVATFIVGQYGGTGTAEVHGSCPHQEASEADYDTTEEKALFRLYHGTDQAYYATYRTEQGESRRVCAVWITDCLCWELYEFPRKSHDDLTLPQPSTPDTL